MNRHSKSSSVLASVMAMILAMPGGAWADGGRDNNGWNKGGNKGNGHYNTHYNNYNYSKNYYGHYQGKSGYYPYYPCNNCGNHNHNNHNHNNNLWIGLLGGGILGYALGTYQHSNTAEPAYYPPASTAPPPATMTRYETAYPGNTCLQQREYRSKIMVGGKQVDGYGTACLQPDGSWRYGPAQAETF
jgi:hypothetical protein